MRDAVGEKDGRHNLRNCGGNLRSHGRNLRDGERNLRGWASNLRTPLLKEGDISAGGNSWKSEKPHDSKDLQNSRWCGEAPLQKMGAQVGLRIAQVAACSAQVADQSVQVHVSHASPIRLIHACRPTV